MAQAGLYFRLDISSGTFIYVGDMGNSSPGDQTVAVTGGGIDVNTAAQKLNTSVLVPTPLDGRFQVAGSTLASATPVSRATLVATTA